MNTKNLFEKIDMPGVKNTIVVASGKGGVGKSTVSANLAMALAREGYKTALFDADLFGPSIPILFGVQGEKPKVSNPNGQERISPIEKYGVKIMSIAFFMINKKSLIWRGPAASAGLTQLLSATEWGEIDYLIIDFPPGTSDVQLTITQKLYLTGSILVTTPQDIAVADALKAADMFQTPKIQVPILGVVENMSYFTPDKHPDEKYFLFGKGGGEKLSSQLNVPLLGQIPLVSDVCELGDNGKSIYLSKNQLIANEFNNLVLNLIETLSSSPKEQLNRT